MDRKELAKKLRTRLFDFIEGEGCRAGALHGDDVDRLFEGVLAEFVPATNPWARPARGASAPLIASAPPEVTHHMIAWADDGKTEPLTFKWSKDDDFNLWLHAT